MINISGLQKTFGKLKVLDDITLQCNKGECIALIGPNGCGKTTLIKSILRMVIPDKGEILFNGKSIKDKDDYRQDIGYMPQIGRYPDNMTIGQVMDTIAGLRINNLQKDTDLMDAYNMKALQNKRMNTLSGGTRQKVSACLAFMFNPAVLILDEPTAGLDPIASEILKNKIICEKEKGKLILISSHQLSDLDNLISEVVFMTEGKLIFHKNVKDLLQSESQNTVSKAIISTLQKIPYE